MSDRSHAGGAGRKSPRPRRAAPGRRGVPDAGRGSRPEDRDEPVRSVVELASDVVRELRSTARPGKADVLIKVFERAASAYLDGDFEEAIRLGEQAKHLALRAASVREFLGLAYYRSGNWKQAAREIAAFARLSGSSAQNPVHADCYRAMGRPERAVELCDEIDASTVSEAVYYEGEIVAAGALADLGRLDEAIARLERLAERPEVAEEHHLRVWYALADLLVRRGRFTQAREWFAAVTAADADATDAPERLEKLRTSS